jgi:hypothetical protein
VHFQVMVDLGPDVSPESSRDVANRARKLVEPYYLEARSTPWKDYMDAEIEGSLIENLADDGFLDRRWDPAVAPTRDPATGMTNLSMSEVEAVRQLWRSIPILYSHSEVADALNRSYKKKPRKGAKPTDHRGDRAHYADEGGLFDWRDLNPNGKWDSAVVGGRYSPYFPLRTQGGSGVQRTDAARKREIDWELLRREWMDAAEHVWQALEELPGGRPAGGYTSYNMGPSTTRQEYLDAVASPITNAFVDAAGRWVDGDVGWGRFGIPEIGYATTFRAWLASVPDDHVLALVDCHG